MSRMRDTSQSRNVVCLPLAIGASRLRAATSLRSPTTTSSSTRSGSPLWWADSMKRATLCVTGLTLASELESPAQQIFEQYGAFNKGFETLLFERDVNLANPLLYPYTAGVFGGGGNCAVRLKCVEGKLEFDRRLGPGTLAYGAEDLDVFLKFILSGKKIQIGRA